VSVRNAVEAEAALVGGAALIDVKEPLRGALGRAEDNTIAAVLRVVAGRRPVSAALGELVEATPPPRVPGLSLMKWGLASAPPHWQSLLAASSSDLGGCRLVAVAYADWQRAAAPVPEEVAACAVDLACGAFLLDTWKKDGQTLCDWLPFERIAALCRICAAAQVPVALAGSLTEEQIETLLPLAPAWFAVRGAVCAAGRESPIDVQRVRRLAQRLGFQAQRCEAASEILS
jgi:uncharacterized protein (UPF0264 family)